MMLDKDIAVCAKVPLGEWKAGSPTHLHEFITNLSKHARIKAYVPYVSGEYSNDGVNIRETGSTCGNPALNMYHFSTSAQLKLLGESQDIIHWRLDLAQELLMFRFIKGKKVCEINGPLLEEQARMRSMPGPVYWAAQQELKHNLRRFDRIVVVSDELKDLVSSNYGASAEKISVVYNGVNTSLFSPGRFQKEADLIREKYGIQDKKVLGFVGGLRPWHGVQYAIEMMARLIKTREDTILFIVGSGHEYENLKTEIHKIGLDPYIIMPGSIPYMDVPKYVEMFDVALAPYPSKGVSNYFNPLKLFEYMAMKKPIICGNTSWAKRFLGNGRGVIINCEDPAVFARSAASLLNDPDTSRKLAENALKSSLKNYTWDNNVSRMIKVYQDLLN